MPERSQPSYTDRALVLLGQEVQIERRLAGLGRQELADRAGVAAETIRRLEAGDPDTAIGDCLEVAHQVALEPFIPDVDPDIVHRSKKGAGGEPVFPGTQVPIQRLHDELRDGGSLAAFLADFPAVPRARVIAFVDLMFGRTLGTLDWHGDLAKRSGAGCGAKR